jgi:hypothetical protein
MKSLRISIAIAWGALAGAGCGCAPEAQGSAVSELTQLEAASDPELIGAAGQGGDDPEVEPKRLPTNGTIVGLDGDDLTGSVSLAAGSDWSGEVSLFCCRDGSYSVYAYEGGLCSDPQTWEVEQSTRVADVSCSDDLGSATYARDPSETDTTAFVVYDASGNALGCADVTTE